MSRLVIIFIGFMTFTMSQAQHCPWDLSYVIIVDVRDGNTGELINGLEITLTDSIGNPAISKLPRANVINRFVFFQDSDTLKFGQNLVKATEKLPYLQEFPLCKACYMLRGSKGELEGNFITIKDTDGEKNLGYFETKIVKITPENVVNLCRESVIWTSMDALNRGKVGVTLQE